MRWQTAQCVQSGNRQPISCVEQSIFWLAVTGCEKFPIVLGGVRWIVGRCRFAPPSGVSEPYRRKYWGNSPCRQGWAPKSRTCVRRCPPESCRSGYPTGENLGRHSVLVPFDSIWKMRYIHRFDNSESQGTYCSVLTDKGHVGRTSVSPVFHGSPPVAERSLTIWLKM